MTKRPDLSTIAPPPRKPAAVPMTARPSSAERVMLNVRVSADRAEYVRVLAAKTRTAQQELIERAIDLLRAEAGEA
jgi:hypothetical protein